MSIIYVKKSRRNKRSKSRRNKRSKSRRNKRPKSLNKRKDGVGFVSKIKQFFTSNTDRCTEAMKILIDFKEKSNKEELEKKIEKYCNNTNYIDVLFLLSCKYGEFIRAKELLDRGANPECVDIFGRTAIMYCVIYNNFNKIFILDLFNRISNKLLKNNAMKEYEYYIFQRRRYAYHPPPDERESFIINTYLNTYLNKKDINDKNVLFYIVNNCNIDFLNVIAKYFTAELDDYSVIDEYTYIQTMNNNNNIIFYMVENCDNDFFNTFMKLTKKYFIYLYHDTLFTYTLRLNKPMMFNTLFDILLDNNKNNGKLINSIFLISHQDDLGMNALMYASEKGYLDIVKNIITLFIECNNKLGAVMSERVFGSFFEERELCKPNKDHMTALMFAAKNNYLNIVKELLDNNIISKYKKNWPSDYYNFINMRDNKGNTAVDYACGNINYDIYNYLISQGAEDIMHCKEYMDENYNTFLLSLFTRGKTGYFEEFKQRINDPENIFSKEVLKFI